MIKHINIPELVKDWENGEVLDNEATITSLGIIISYNTALCGYGESKQISISREEGEELTMDFRYVGVEDTFELIDLTLNAGVDYE